jgi:hypothetical protein
MFQLHDRTRRRVCITGFLALGVTPTLLAALWCLTRHAPGRVDAEAQQLGRQLGLDVKLGGLKYLRPDVMLYEQLELSDPETGKSVFRCRLLEVAQTKESGQQGQPVLLLTASQPEVDAAAVDRVWQCLQRTLKSRHGQSESDLQLAAAEVTLRAANGSQTLTEVGGTIESLPGGARAQLRFRLAGVDSPEPTRISIVRNRQLSPPAGGFELDTGGGELPCNVLAIGLSELKPLGPRCRFRGCIWANETPNGWEGEVTGQLADVDFGSLVTDHFPHRLAGAGTVTVQSARFRGGRLEEGSAIVTAGPGAIDRSLIAAAVDRLGLAAGPERLPAVESVPYEQLAFAATLDAHGLRLRGCCAAAEPGTILSDGRNRLLGEPIRQPAPAVALVQTLVPESAVQVPASRQTDWLLRHLPVPDVVSPPGTEDVAPHARVRLRDTWQR